MRFYEIITESSHDERMQRARDQGFDVDNPHYHGTPGGDFEEFDPHRTPDENLAYGKGIYLTRDPAAASGYSRPGSSWGNDHDEEPSPTVYKVFHRVKNPFDMTKAYPFAEIKRIFEHCFTPKELQYIDFWQEVLKDSCYHSRYYEQIEELEDQLNNLDWGNFEGAPDPEDYEDGKNDVDYETDLEEAIEYEKKSINRRLAWLNEKEIQDKESHDRGVANGNIAGAWGRDIYKTLWTNTSGYHDWKAESQLFGGESETFEFKTEANKWLEELGYDGLTHTDSYNPGNRGASHNVTIAFKPEQVRSAHANFHPDKINSPKMSESAERVKLSDLYDNSELYDRSEAIGVMVYNYGSGFLYEEFTVREMQPSEARKLKSNGGKSIMAAYKKSASQEQKEIVADKKRQFDPSRIIVLSRNRVIDGHHHLIAAIELNRPVKYIDLEEESLTEARLNELARPENRVTADMVLRKAGYTRLGKGEHGAVYTKPDRDYVLKVFSSLDAAYLDFIHLSQRHQNNPHFPKFYGKVVQVTPKYYAVRTERLIPAWVKVDFVRNYLLYSKGDPDNAFIARVLADMEKHPELKECCDLIIDEHFPKFDPDPCDENIMMRDNTIVITDPTVVYGPSAEDFEVLPNDDGKPVVPEKPYGKEDGELLNALFKKSVTNGHDSRQA